ncbi:MAG: glycosyltransferase family 4 protein [Chloroflexi bacterium]|nr:glycosyltransferase family 4 protein [Chloroflexota bacterium]
MTPSLRILYLLTQDLESPSGLGRYWPMARELARLGHQVSIAALHSNYPALEKRSDVEQGVAVHYVAPMHVQKLANVKTYYSPARLLGVAALAAWRLARAALAAPVDILHVGKPHPMNSLAGLAGRLRRSRQLYLDCDDYEAGVGHFKAGWQKRGVEFFENAMPRRVDYLTTNTYFTRNRLEGLGAPPERIYYLSNGVDRQRFLPPPQEAIEALRARLGLLNRPVIVFVGSLSRPGHPVELLFQAFARVRRQLPQAMLLLVGGGDDFDHLHQEARQMGLADAVVFTGRIPPAQAGLYYRLGQVSIDPVYPDAAANGRSPLKLFESWACNVPFVSADVGDRRILLGDPPAGMLALPGDPESLAACILQALTDPALADSLRQRGAQRVQSYYWDTLVKDLETVYLSNLPGGHRFLNGNLGK